MRARARWLPLQPTPEMLKDRGYHFLNIVAMLRPEVSVAQAQHELDTLASHFPVTKDGFPATFRAIAPAHQQVLDGAGAPGWCQALFAVRWRWCC